MKTVFLAVLMLGMLIATSVSAIEVTVTGVSVGISFTEPTTNENGTTLSDLKECFLSYDIGGGWILGNTVPASKVSGGGTQATSFEVPVLAGMEKDVKFKGNARDLSGNVSKDSAIVTKRIDRLAPDTIQ